VVEGREVLADTVAAKVAAQAAETGAEDAQAAAEAARDEAVEVEQDRQRVVMVDGDPRGVELFPREQITDFPVPTFRPTTADTVCALDIMPKGTPEPYGSEGLICWIDVCDLDIEDGSPTPLLNCARVGVAEDFVYFGGVRFNSVTPKDVHLGYAGVERMILTAGKSPGAAFTLASVTVVSAYTSSQMVFGVMDTFGNMDFYVNGAGQLWAPQTYNETASVLPNLNISSTGKIQRASRATSAIVAVADNAVYSIALPLSASGYLIVTTANSTARMLAYAETLGAASTLVAVDTGSVTTLTTGVLTGTTGADGDFTISLDAGTLYVENRLGSSLNVTIVGLGV
jgi:hypothetical protein